MQPENFRPPGFSVEQESLADAPGVRVSGEVDLSTAPQLTAVLERMIPTTQGPLVVDLCDVEFVGSSAISVLLRIRAVLGREDRQMLVVCPQGPIRRTFDTAGVGDVFLFFESREQAAAALKPVG